MNEFGWSVCMSVCVCVSASVCLCASLRVLPLFGACPGELDCLHLSHRDKPQLTAGEQHWGLDWSEWLWSGGSLQQRPGGAAGVQHDRVPARHVCKQDLLLLRFKRWGNFKLKVWFQGKLNCVCWGGFVFNLYPFTWGPVVLLIMAHRNRHFIEQWWNSQVSLFNALTLHRVKRSDRNQSVSEIRSILSLVFCVSMVTRGITFLK